MQLLQIYKEVFSSAIELLILAAVILICVLLNKLTSRLGIPVLLAFILLGMAFGSDGFVKISFDRYDITESICTAALILIMFYGGFDTKWSEAKPVAVKSVLLSSFGVMITAALTGLFCHYALGMPILEGLLIGSIVGSTDAASVFSILRSKRLNLKYNTASMLEVESGSNDPFAYMLTIIVLTAMNGEASGGQFAYMIFAQIVYGAAFGVAIAFAALFVLRRLRLTSGFDMAFVLGIAVLSYAAAALAGGNGYISAYIVGIILGNQRIPNKRSLVHFFDGMTGLMQMLIFFLLGLLSFPSHMPAVLLTSLAIAVFLTFVARPAAVFAILSPFRCPMGQKLIVSWAGLRGAASIVFAIVATIHPAALQNDVFHIVMCIVLFSIALQGSLIPVLSRRLGMIDDNANVLRTFNDFSEEVPVQFVKLAIKPGHPWEGKRVRDICLPPDTLLVMVLRGLSRITPGGGTQLLEGDTLVLSAKAVEDDIHIQLCEMAVGKEHEWNGKRLSDISGNEGLVIMVRRGDKIVIPSGKTVIKAGDVLVMNAEE